MSRHRRLSREWPSRTWVERIERQHRPVNGFWPENSKLVPVPEGWLVVLLPRLASLHRAYYRKSRGWRS